MSINKKITILSLFGAKIRRKHKLYVKQNNVILMSKITQLPKS